MFRNLIESGSHTRDLKRRGAFFLGTLFFYTALLVAAGVGSIFAYNAHVEEGELELVTLMRFPPAQPVPEAARQVRPRQTTAARDDGGGNRMQVAVVREPPAVINPNISDRPAADANARELPADLPYEIGPADFIPGRIGGSGSPTGSGDEAGGREGGTGRAVIPVTDDVPEKPSKKEPTPQPTPQIKRVSTHVLQGMATSKPAPPYPPIAKAAGVSGTVAVQVLIDEGGRVVSAQATSGHPLLRDAAVRAAYQAKFSKTLLGGQAVKVSGVITYNFVLR